MALTFKVFLNIARIPQNTFLGVQNVRSTKIKIMGLSITNLWDPFARCAWLTNSLNLKHWISNVLDLLSFWRNKWIILIFINAKNLTSLRSNSETMCRLFLRFQVSKVSLTKHCSNETKYGQKNSAGLEIIGLEK